MKDSMYAAVTKVLAWLVIYFSPVVPFLLSIGFFSALDTILGLRVAHKRGTYKLSRVTRKTLDKVFSYTAIILAANVFEKQFTPDFPALKVVGGALAFIELMSINENAKILTGKDMLGAVLNRITKKLRKDD